nr:CPCC family cysteine-rich protein [Cytobacillus firmus]
MKYACPCCGYKTLQQEPPGTYEICEICFWEDDDVQFNDPDYEGGANLESLRQYQKAFIAGRVNRQPNNNDERDPSWKPLSLI